MVSGVLAPAHGLNQFFRGGAGSGGGGDDDDVDEGAAGDVRMGVPVFRMNGCSEDERAWRRAGDVSDLSDASEGERVDPL
eukprot:2564618-Alexandrium_andersonii.AAC.1